MPTNDERREVAARLRNWESFRETFRESPICAVIDALGVEGYLDWRGVFELLAGLIEPGPERTCNNSYVGGCTVAFKCSACGESCFYPKKGNGKYVAPRYYPICGAEVVS